jgi:hypothetical protein
MIAAPVQGDVDGIPKGSHYASVSPMGYARRERDAKLLLTLINALTVHANTGRNFSSFLCRLLRNPNDEAQLRIILKASGNLPATERRKINTVRNELVVSVIRPTITDSRLNWRGWRVQAAPSHLQRRMRASHSLRATK